MGWEARNAMVTMTQFADHTKITTEIAYEVAKAFRSAGWSAEIGFSGQSPSRYVDATQGEATFCVRVSNHEARSYNRTGDFNISISGVDGDTHETVAVTDLEDEDDGEYFGSEVEADEIARVVQAAVAAAACRLA